MSQQEERFTTIPRINTLPQNPDVGNTKRPLGRFPKWLHRTLPEGNALFQTRAVIDKHALHTVCEEAKCPNLLECYSKKTATFLVLGKACTRHCGFCEIDFTKTPQAPRSTEPEEVAQSVIALGLKHVVITMVARDDLPDGGSAHLVQVIKEVRKQCPDTTVETLVSDFKGNFAAFDLLLAEKPEIFNHNIETVKRLSPKVRHQATYHRSLSILEYVKKSAPDILVKSGLMVGLGETKEEVLHTLKELHFCDIVTIGQYLQASHKKLSVKEFVHPDVFREYEEAGKKAGIRHVYAAPFVRSSYNAQMVLTRV